MTHVSVRLHCIFVVFVVYLRNHCDIVSLYGGVFAAEKCVVTLAPFIFPRQKNPLQVTETNNKSRQHQSALVHEKETMRFLDTNTIENEVYGLQQPHLHHLLNSLKHPNGTWYVLSTLPHHTFIFLPPSLTFKNIHLHIHTHTFTTTKSIDLIDSMNVKSVLHAKNIGSQKPSPRFNC